MNASDMENEALNVISEVNRGPQETDPNLLEAMKRIEEANLLYTLVKNDIFAPGSARPEILNSVNDKVKQFAKRELNRLLGMSKEGEIESPGLFSKEEITALKVLAATMLKKDPSKIAHEIKRPTLNQVVSSPTTPISPQVNTIQAPPAVVQNVSTEKEDQILSKTLDRPPTKEEREAAKRAILEKARKAKASKAAAAAAAPAPAGGGAGYAVPPNYVAPKQGVIQPTQPLTANGLDVTKLVQGLGIQNQQSVVTLPDTDIGGDPNARL